MSYPPPPPPGPEDPQEPGAQPGAQPGPYDAPGASAPPGGPSEQPGPPWPGSYGAPGYPPPGQPGGYGYPGQPGPPPQQPWSAPAPPPYPPGSTPSTPWANNATLSLIFGIFSLCSCGPFLGIPAIILGVKGRRQVRESEGRLAGDGIAIAGIVTGIAGTILWLLIGIVVVIAIALGGQARDVYEKNCSEYFSDSGTSVHCQLS